MSQTKTVLKGVVHGKIIKLEDESGLPDGQQVRVIIQPASPASELPQGEGIRRSAGAWSDDPEGLDEYLQQLRKDRDRDRPPIEP